jgi:hypothetical protein
MARAPGHAWASAAGARLVMRGHQRRGRGWSCVGISGGGAAGHAWASEAGAPTATPSHAALPQWHRAAPGALAGPPMLAAAGLHHCVRVRAAAARAARLQQALQGAVRAVLEQQRVVVQPRDARPAAHVPARTRGARHEYGMRVTNTGCASRTRDARHEHGVRVTNTGCASRARARAAAAPAACASAGHAWHGCGAQPAAPCDWWRIAGRRTP